MADTGFRIHIAGDSGSKGMVFDVQGTRPAPSGSHDVTIVTLRAGERTFSFALPDVDRGPLYLPDFDSYVSLASDPRPFDPSLVKPGERIRERLAREPEQTYERATNEIPGLDPVERQGERLYLPLTIYSTGRNSLWPGAAMCSHKQALKAKGAELKRLEWQGQRLEWRFGTGAEPTFRPGAGDSRLRVLEDFLPVAIGTWKTGDIEYREEAFATSLAGPLGWEGRANKARWCSPGQGHRPQHCRPASSVTSLAWARSRRDFAVRGQRASGVGRAARCGRGWRPRRAPGRVWPRLVMLAPRFKACIWRPPWFQRVRTSRGSPCHSCRG